MMAIGPFMAAAILLVVAGATKVVRPDGGARAVAGLVPRLAGRARPIVRALAAAEAAIGFAALTWPAAVTAGLLASSYAAFAVVVLLARSRGGVLATCGCFGGIDTPPTLAHALLDMGAAVAAITVGVDFGDHGRLLTGLLARQPAHGIPLLAGSAVIALLALTAMSLLPRLQAVRAELRRAP
jgi:hypothetical protein